MCNVTWVRYLKAYIQHYQQLKGRSKNLTVRQIAISFHRESLMDHSCKESCLYRASAYSYFIQCKCSLTSEHLSDIVQGCSSLCQPNCNRSTCWSEKECTVYWPQFCGSVVSNFTARFLSALTVMNGMAMREQGHLVAEPQSAPLSWQAWWMQADEYTHSLALLHPVASLCEPSSEIQCCNELWVCL